MTSAQATTDCRFCSQVSKANGEDPIGSAPVTDHWLITEMPLPWSAQIMKQPQIQPVLSLIKTLALAGVRVRPIAIAPDREYSQAGYRRVLFYSRPDRFFATYQKQEYLLPEAEVAPLAVALLKQIANQPNDLKRFEGYRQANGLTRDLLVCTHGNVDAACARFGFPIYDKLRKHYADGSATNEQGQLRVWRCSHFGGHQYAPTLLDLPEGRYWGHLEPEMLDQLVYRSGIAADLGRFYRGCAGLGKFEQIAEREIWLQEGWQWLTFAKQGRVVRLGESWFKRCLRSALQWIPSKRLRFLLERSKQDAVWAEVQIDYATSEGSKGSYRARVAVSGQIMTAIRSAEPIEQVPVNQYQVTALVKLG